VDNAMQPSPEPSAPAVASFGPDRRFTAAAGAGVLVAAVVAALTGDPQGRLLAIVAALVLLGYVVTDLVFAPRLVAGPAGVRINSPLLRAELSWPEVADVRADVRSRYGLRSTTLEIDTGATIAIFTRRTLGADPEDAADLVLACRA
jgi:hypothetical protein